jgi:D-alanine-D-alanine ligase
MKKKIALLTGGYSGEAAISYKSSVTFYNNLKNRFQVYTIDINPHGWFYEDEKGEKIAIDKNDFSLHIDGEKITFDVIFIGIHGTPGEDGKLQGYFDVLGLPYTSCNVATSSLTFNKRYTTAVAAAYGIPVANSVLLIKNNFQNPDEIAGRLKFPVFVKPNNGGSSIGMSKVNQLSDELGVAIEKAFKEDDQVLVEEMISGREFTIGVFKSKGQIIALPITEVISKKDFFDFEAKYEGASQEITPAEINEDWKSQVENTARKIYQVFNCNGVVRIDFIYNAGENKPYMLEINTVPGQSEASIIPQQVKAMGWTLEEFYTALVEDALTNH